MFLTASANGALPKQSHQTGQSFDRYTEQEIQQVATDLLKHGYHSWSNNPRLYIILRDIGQIKDTSQPQTLDVLLKNGLNDMWIPITTDTTLQRLLKPEIYFQFLQAQNSVCIQSTSFRLRTPGFHGHFATRYDAPFERRRSIGRGRIGRVDEVLSLTDRRVYARKSIRKVSDFGDTRGRDDIERFRCEVRVLRRIQHRHCVRIVGSYTNPRILAIVMSPVADSNLKDFLQLAETSSKPHYALRIREWFGCLATAIQHLHTNHIRHRDIKPANILVHGANVLLVDFELALDWRDLGQSTTNTNRGRTPLYAAPEVMQELESNSTSDIWSLGCVFLEMVTVVKGISITELRQYFISQTTSPLFSNNPKGIEEWISHLQSFSSDDNAPLLWTSRMLQVDRTFRARAAEIIDEIRNTRVATPTNQPNPYFGKCCQRICLTGEHMSLCMPCGMEVLENSPGFHSLGEVCSRAHQTRIYRNPQMFPGILPFQPLMSYLHPSFMIQHLTQRSLKEFRRSVIANEQWESFGVDVQLLCLPSQPLHLKIRRYVPLCHLYSLQTQSDSQAMAICYSLPVGIYRPAQKATARRFNEYLDEMINNNLPDYARFMHNLRGFDHSSRTLEVLLLCFQQWKDNSTNNPQYPSHELLLMQNAIKLIVIQSVLGLGLILENIPVAFTHSPFPSPTGPQLAFPDNQIPRLLNRQVKIIFFAIYKTLLLQVLTGFKAVASNKKSWGTSVFVGICLAFLLERIEAGSQEYLFFAKSVYRDEEDSLGDAEAYSREVESAVFDRIYRILGTVVNMKTDYANAMALELLDSLRWVREGFKEKGQEIHHAEIRAPHSSRLVSALADLVLYT